MSPVTWDPEGGAGQEESLAGLPFPEEETEAQRGEPPAQSQRAKVDEARLYVSSVLILGAAFCCVYVVVFVSGFQSAENNNR